MYNIVELFLSLQMFEYDILARFLSFECPPIPPIFWRTVWCCFLNWPAPMFGYTLAISRFDWNPWKSHFQSQKSKVTRSTNASSFESWIAAEFLWYVFFFFLGGYPSTDWIMDSGHKIAIKIYRCYGTWHQKNPFRCWLKRKVGCPWFLRHVRSGWVAELTHDLRVFIHL